MSEREVPRKRGDGFAMLVRKRSALRDEAPEEALIVIVAAEGHFSFELPAVDGDACVERIRFHRQKATAAEGEGKCERKKATHGMLRKREG